MFYADAEQDYRRTRAKALSIVILGERSGLRILLLRLYTR